MRKLKNARFKKAKKRLAYGLGGLVGIMLAGVIIFILLVSIGYAPAQYRLGKIYYDVSYDSKKGIKYFKLAADKGHLNSQYNLGKIYYWGIGTKKDYEKASKYYTLAIEQGGGNNIGYLNEIGEIYLTGEVSYREEQTVPIDYQLALRNFEIATKYGNRRVPKNLGDMYASGQGVVQNDEKAEKYWRIAVERGNKDALFEIHKLGVSYNLGVNGVPQDYAKAFERYHFVIKYGNRYAQKDLGVLYYRWLGIAENKILAYMWFNLASAQGVKEASKNRELIASQMTKAEIAEAQKLSRECLAKKYKDCAK